MRTCTVPGCTNRHKAHGYCRRHYRQALKTGTIPRRASTDDQLAPAGGLCFWPTRSRATRDALYALAMSNPTPTEYAERKDRIKRGDFS